MGTTKTLVGVAVLAVIALVAWRLATEDGARTPEPSARSAPVVAGEAEPGFAADPGALRTPALVEAGTGILDNDALTVPASTPPTAAVSSPPGSAASTSLERYLSEVAESFLTEEPDVDGLLSLTTTLASAANLVPGSLIVSETNGNASGKVELGGKLKGTFSIVGNDVSVDLDVWDTQARAQRVLSLSFRDEDGLARRARVTVQSYPDADKTAHADALGGRELIGWRAEIDPLDGATLYRTTTVIEDPFPSAKNYVFGTGPAEGFAPRPTPALASTGAFDAWLERCQALRGR